MPHWDFCWRKVPVDLSQVLGRGRSVRSKHRTVTADNPGKQSWMILRRRLEMTMDTDGEIILRNYTNAEKRGAHRNRATPPRVTWLLEIPVTRIFQVCKLVLIVLSVQAADYFHGSEAETSRKKSRLEGRCWHMLCRGAVANGFISHQSNHI